MFCLQKISFRRFLSEDFFQKIFSPFTSFSLPSQVFPSLHKFFLSLHKILLSLHKIFSPFTSLSLPSQVFLSLHKIFSPFTSFSLPSQVFLSLHKFFSPFYRLPPPPNAYTTIPNTPPIHQPFRTFHQIHSFFTHSIFILKHRMTEIIWLGHACFLIKTQNARILIDPFLSNPMVKILDRLRKLGTPKLFY